LKRQNTDHPALWENYLLPLGTLSLDLVSLKRLQVKIKEIGWSNLAPLSTSIHQVSRDVRDTRTGLGRSRLLEAPLPCLAGYDTESCLESQASTLRSI